MFDRFYAWATARFYQIEELKNDEGQTFVEYALILAVVVVALLAAMTLTGLTGAIGGAMQRVTNAINGTPAP
jgi:Flp pilus assembly pilin Flp